MVTLQVKLYKLDNQEGKQQYIKGIWNVPAYVVNLLDDQNENK